MGVGEGPGVGVGPGGGGVVGSQAERMKRTGRATTAQAETAANDFTIVTSRKLPHLRL
jgi:hypothetical protein